MFEFTVFQKKEPTFGITLIFSECLFLKNFAPIYNLQFFSPKSVYISRLKKKITSSVEDKAWEENNGK